MKGTIGIEDIVKSLDGIFLVDNCILSRDGFDNYLFPAQKYSQIDTFALQDIHDEQKRINNFLNNKKIYTINEVVQEFEKFVEIIEGKHEYLNKMFAKKKYQRKEIWEPEEENKEILGKFCLLTQQTLKKLNNNIIKAENFGSITEVIKKIQKLNDICYKEKPDYRGTDEKLIAASLSLGHPNKHFYILTRDGKIMKTLRALSKDPYISKHFDKRDRARVKFAPVQAFYFDENFDYVSDVKYPHPEVISRT